MDDAVAGCAGAPTGFGPYDRRWGPRDCMVYALGVGAGTEELRYATDGTPDRPQRVIPTFMINQGLGGRGFRQSCIGDPRRTVHAGHRLVLHRPVPTSGAVRSTGRVAETVSKRTGRLVTVEWSTRDAADETLVCENTISYFVRGPDRGARSEPSRYEIGRPVPRTTPRAAVTEATLPTQALLYRCSGDPNPTTPTPGWPGRPGSAGRSCTDCARSASPPARCCAWCATTTRARSARWTAVSSTRATPATR